VAETERRQACDTLPSIASGDELVDRRIHVDRVPEHDEIDNQAECSKIIFLSFAIALAQCAMLPVENDAGELVSAFVTFELDKYPASVAWLSMKCRRYRVLMSRPSSCKARARRAGRSLV
jgi:hypothetical protein